MPVRRTLLLALLLALAARGAGGRGRPNVVVIETDDQTMADLASMPETQRLIGDRGVSFSNSVVSLSQCCPSRATFLTGRYAHNHGVRTTAPPYGGFHAFDDAETLAVWLQRAGYATALVGKYMNQYGKDDPSYVPPGWTDWHALLGPSTYYFWNFGISEDGTALGDPAAYQTDVLTAALRGFLRRARERRPPVLPVDHLRRPAPRRAAGLLLPPRFGSAVPSPLFASAFVGAMPRTPAFDEADVSDKPPRHPQPPRLGPAELRALDEVWRKRQQSLLSVDQGVRRLVHALEAAGELNNTLLIFTSDNGYLIGEHRIRESKVLPYEPSIRVPLLMRGPGIPRGTTRSQLVWNGDLAPTILDATGARAAWEPDGMSLLPFVRDATRARSGRAVLLEGPPDPAQTGSAPSLHGPAHARAPLRREPHRRARALRPAARPLRAATTSPAPRRSRRWSASSRRGSSRLRDCAGADCRTG